MGTREVLQRRNMMKLSMAKCLVLALFTLTLCDAAVRRNNRRHRRSVWRKATQKAGRFYRNGKITKPQYQAVCNARVANAHADRLRLSFQKKQEKFLAHKGEAHHDKLRRYFATKYKTERNPAVKAKLRDNFVKHHKRWVLAKK